MGVFFTFVKLINTSFDNVNNSVRDEALKFIERVNNIVDCFNVKEDIVLEDEAKINKLIEERSIAKKNKDFALADKIRDELIGMGIEIMDTPQGVKWKRK